MIPIAKHELVDFYLIYLFGTALVTKLARTATIIFNSQ